MHEESKAFMFSEFDMTDNGLMSYFLGTEVKQQKDEIFISQKKYMKEMLEKFQMNECHSVNTRVATGMKLSREGDKGFVDSSLLKTLHGSLKIQYYLWSRTCMSLHGDTEGISLASCEEDTKVY